jgi:hypothetical protein
VHTAVAGYAAWRLLRRAPVPVDEQSHFASIPARGGSVLVSALNPEAYDEEDEPVFDTEQIAVVSIEE